MDGFRGSSVLFTLQSVDKISIVKHSYLTVTVTINSAVSDDGQLVLCKSLVKGAVIDEGVFKGCIACWVNKRDGNMSERYTYKRCWLVQSSAMERWDPDN